MQQSCIKASKARLLGEFLCLTILAVPQSLWFSYPNRKEESTSDLTFKIQRWRGASRFLSGAPDAGPSPPISKLGIIWQVQTASYAQVMITAA